MEHDFNPCTREADLWVRATLVYILSSRIARVTETPCLKIKKQNKTNKSSGEDKGSEKTEKMMSAI